MRHTARGNGDRHGRVAPVVPHPDHPPRPATLPRGAFYVHGRDVPPVTGGQGRTTHPSATAPCPRSLHIVPRVAPSDYRRAEGVPCR